MGIKRKYRDNGIDKILTAFKSVLKINRVIVFLPWNAFTFGESSPRLNSASKYR